MMHHSNTLRLLAILTVIALPSFATHATAEPVPPHSARVPDDRFQQMAQETAKTLQAEPFVWISFHDEAAYGRFMKEFRPVSTAGSRAYYSTETHSVYIQTLVGHNNRDVQKNMQKAVQCLDQRIAILRQTPAIQDMHRQWADWMRTTFPKLPNAPTKHPLTDLSDDRNAAISRVIIKGVEPDIIYIPIIHDDQFSHIPRCNFWHASPPPTPHLPFISTTPDAGGDGTLVHGNIFLRAGHKAVFNYFGGSDITVSNKNPTWY